MKRLSPKDKIKLQKNIHEYSKRRILYKSQGKPTKRISTKICNLKRNLLKIEQKEAILNTLCKKSVDFFNVNIKDIQSSKKPRDVNIKGIFCKFAMEEYKISGKFIAEFLKWDFTNGVYKARRKFQKKLKNKENLILYQKFKQHVKEQEETKN